MINKKEDLIMKKIYMKPEMQVHQIKRMTILQGSVTGVHGKIVNAQGEEIESGLKYGGYVDEEQEDEFDPD